MSNIKGKRLAKIISCKELSKLDEDFLENLSKEDLLLTSKCLLATAKTLSDKINKNSQNSSMPPSSDMPWSKTKKPKSDIDTEESHKINAEELAPKTRKKRDKGYGRSQKLPITKVIKLYPEVCDHCGSLLREQNAKAYTAYYQIDLERVNGIGGYKSINTKYILYSNECIDCHKITEYKPKRYKTCIDTIKLSNWRLLGPTLLSVIVYLNKDQGLSIRKIKRLLRELYGLYLSNGILIQGIHEAGLSGKPIEKQLKEELLSSDLLHSDETSWLEGTKGYWLWVHITASTCLFLLGGRTKQMAQEIINDKFNGWLMSDGYKVYRDHQKRLRCWAHLKRKAKGLEESNWIQAHFFGKEILALLKNLMISIYDARARGDPQSIKEQHQKELEEFMTKCNVYKECEHEDTKKLAKEFLNDWTAIFMVLEHPYLPLTNNEAERALRHWVIIRRLSQGTRTPIGSIALTSLASIIETCKLRGKKILEFLTDLIRFARIGQELSIASGTNNG